MRTWNRAPRSRGFTLLELVVVIAIVGMLATIVAFRIGPIRDNAERTKVQADQRQILDGAKALYALLGRYPQTLDEFVDAVDAKGHPVGIFEELPIDPWGRDYLYEIVDGSPRVTCLGRDGADGGEGPDEDTVAPKPR
jgi:general secretion pathway protein G